MLPFKKLEQASTVKKESIYSTAVLTVLSLLVLMMLQSCGEHGKPADGSETSAGKTAEEKIASAKAEPEGGSKGEAKNDTMLVVRAQLHELRNKIDVPGELLAYQDVPIHAKVEGFISWIGVDRGSWVKKGQKMITISCPELIEKIDEANAKLSAAQAVVTRSESALQNEKAKLLEEKAKSESDDQTYKRMADAAKTPGAVAQNDVDVAGKTVEADQGRVQAGKAAISAAEAVVVAEKKNVTASERVLKSLKAMQSYLTIEAPFDGVISSRNVHEGSIVAVDASRSSEPLVRVQQVSLLRLVAAIPEDAVGSLHDGAKVHFTTPAFPGRDFIGIVARPAFSLDTSTRTMPVELNVPNEPRVLDPGMYCNVEWVVSRPYKTVFLPSSAVGTDLVSSFVNKIVDGVNKRVPVKKGDQMGDLIEVVGEIKDGDEVALKASNEKKDGAHVSVQLASAEDLKKANTKAEKAGGE